MDKFQKIREVLHYIDDHLDEIADYEQVPACLPFSPHLLSPAVLCRRWKPIAAYMRTPAGKGRRLLADPDQTVTSICFECGFNSSQAFSRAFRNSYGISPTDYRKLGYTPVVMSVEEIVEKFSSRLRGESL